MPLAAAICIEAYLARQVATGNGSLSLSLSLSLAAASAVVFVALWYILPRVNQVEW